MRAEIEFEPESLNTEEIERTWCIPFLGDYLVRITPGISNFEKLRVRSKYSRRLIDLPENTNEVLLWRQIRRTRAKSLHIFKNTNGNNMRSATVYFLNEKDLLDSSRFATYYYDDKLRWASLKDNNLKSKQNAEIQEEAQESTQKRSEKSLGKMREVEQDPIEESSKHAQRRLWNREEKSTVWKDFSVKETQENKQRRHESLRTELSGDNESSDSTEGRNHKEIFSVKKKRSHYAGNGSSHRKGKREKRSLRGLLESLLALTEEEESKSSSEGSYWNYRVPNRS